MVTEVSCGGLIFGVSCRGPWFARDHFASALLLSATNILADRVNIVMELCRVFLTMFSDFFDDRIAKHG